MLPFRICGLRAGKEILPLSHNVLCRAYSSSITNAAQAKTADVSVIGSGIIGASIALELSRKGYKVLVVDKLPGAGQGSTSYSSGICRMFYSVLDSVKFSWEGYHYYKNWDDHIQVIDPRGHAKLRECGGVILHSNSTDDWVNKMMPMLDEAGVPWEYWDLSSLEQRLGKKSPFKMNLSSFAPPKRIDDENFGVPNSDPLAAVKGAVFVQSSGYVSDPNLAVLNLQMAAEATGNCTFLFGNSVTKIIRNTQDSGVEGLALSNGTCVSSPIVVNVGGPHSSHITDMAFSGGAARLNDMTMTTRALRQEVAYVKAPEGMFGASDWSDQDGVTLPMMADTDTGIYFRPEVGGKILMGTTEPECDHPLEYVSDPDDINPSLTDNHTNYMWRLALRIPNVELPRSSETQGIVACYDVTEDWTPIYDKSKLRGYYMAIGTSGNQFKNAGVAGALMAELIERTESDHWDSDDGWKFPLKHTLNSVNASIFSRKRNTLDTSASVLG